MPALKIIGALAYILLTGTALLVVGMVCAANVIYAFQAGMYSWSILSSIGFMCCVGTYWFLATGWDDICLDIIGKEKPSVSE